MAVIWPEALPGYILTEGFKREFEENKIRTNMDAGIVKVRKRFTKQVELVTANILITSQQMLELDTFYNVTLDSGVSTFYYICPIAKCPRTYRFIERPSYTHVGGDYYKAMMKWETVLSGAFIPAFAGDVDSIETNDTASIDATLLSNNVGTLSEVEYNDYTVTWGYVPTEGTLNTSEDEDFTTASGLVS